VNAILRTFKRPRVLLPVVHCVEIGQAQTAVAIAMEQGADGVFLINQGGVSASRVVDLAEAAVRCGVPFVGVNLLGRCLGDALDDIAGRGVVHALWTDNGGVYVNRGHVVDDQAVAFTDARKKSGWGGLHFGGVAFKYQDLVALGAAGDVALAAKDAGIEVVTTSGPGTGEPPTVEKVSTMRAAIGDHALAVASGITPENVGSFLPYVDAFLVATGIEESFGVFDSGKVRALADQIHAEDKSYQRYRFLASSPYRTDEEEREIRALRETHRARHGRDPGFEDIATREGT